jgi:polyhydroxybutyrate depolymerase
VLVVAALAACGGEPPTEVTDAPPVATTLPAVAKPALPSAGCRAGAQTQVRAERRTLAVGDETRGYWLDVPTGRADEPRPLVLVFHGFDGQPRRLRRWTGFGRLAQRNGFIAVFPEGHAGVELRGKTGVGWDMYPHESRDATFVSTLLDHLERDFCVDRARVYAAGLSNGGFFANLLGCRLADRLAGIAAVAGSMPLRECAPARPVAVQIIHGRRDQIVKPELAQAARDWWVRTNGCGEPVEERHCRHYRDCTRAPVSYCEAGQGHWWPRPAARRMWRFWSGDEPGGPAGGGRQRPVAMPPGPPRSP